MVTCTKDLCADASLHRNCRQGRLDDHLSVVLLPLCVAVLGGLCFLLRLFRGHHVCNPGCHQQGENFVTVVSGSSVLVGKRNDVN